MPAKVSRKEKDAAILTCRICKVKQQAKGNFYFQTKEQRYFTVGGIEKYCTIESYSRTCIECHKRQYVVYRNRKPELYKAINRKSYHKTKEQL